MKKILLILFVIPIFLTGFMVARMLFSSETITTITWFALGSNAVASIIGIFGASQEIK